MSEFLSHLSENINSFLRQLPSLADIPNWALCLIIGLIYFAYYYCNVVKPPVLACASSKYRLFLERNVPLIKEKYWPTIWCIESRLQTVIANFFRSHVDINYIREILNLEDGGQVALDWDYPTKADENTPIILILPGLTGDSQASYVKKFVISGVDEGFRMVVFNYRGLGGIPLKTPKTYCITSSDDLNQVVRHVKLKYPNAPIGGVGISLGGLILGYYLANQSTEEQLFCASMLISVPFDIFKAVESMEQSGLNRLINKHLADCLVNTVIRRRDVLETGDEPWKLPEVAQSKTVREFDSSFTIKQFGYETVEHYYADASLHDKLGNIRTPVLCLSAADDPFQPLENPLDADKLFNVELVGVLVTVRGGHIAFLEGLFPLKKRSEYMHRVSLQFFHAMFRDSAYKNFIPQSS